MEITQAQFTSIISDLASMKATAEAHKNATEKILRMLEGNGQPGLVESSIVMRKDLEEATNQLEETSKSVEKVTSMVSDLEKIVEELRSDFRRHTADGNPQHETIIAVFRAKPLQFISSIVIILGVVVVGTISGFFEHIVAWFQGFIH